MPWEIRKSGKGYKVFKKNGKKSYSKKPMSKKKAKAQLAAMHANVKEDIHHDFMVKIDEALGISEITKGPTLGATKSPSTGHRSEASDISTKTNKDQKKKAIKIEDEVLEAG